MFFFFYFIEVFIFFSVCFCVLLKGDKEIWQQQANLLPKPRLPVDVCMCFSLARNPEPGPKPIAHASAQSPSAADMLEITSLKAGENRIGTSRWC